MKSPEEALLSFFTLVAQKNVSVLEKLEPKQCFKIDEKKWQFILPDLYTFLQCHNQAFSDVEYPTFRRILFNCPINQTIKSHNAEICISENYKNTDKSHYALLWKD